jgi:hypothetical protein
MRVQKGQAGQALLNIIPRYLIVPAALETDAEVLIASTAKPDQANSRVPNAEFIQSLILVVEPRLDEDSETAWYLAASSQQIDTVEVGYLDGHAASRRTLRSFLGKELEQDPGCHGQIKSNHPFEEHQITVYRGKPPIDRGKPILITSCLFGRGAGFFL